MTELCQGKMKDNKKKILTFFFFFLLSFLKHINLLSQLFTLHFHIVHPIPFNLIYTLLGLSFRLTKLCAFKLYTMIFSA